MWLCDASGSPLSNFVVLDEPARLRGWLEERASGGDRPSELTRPITTLLLGGCSSTCTRSIFDIEETSAATRARRLANEDAAETDKGWDFIEEL